jgi:hypothetical protein
VLLPSGLVPPAVIIVSGTRSFRARWMAKTAENKAMGVAWGRMGSVRVAAGRADEVEGDACGRAGAAGMSC